MKLLNLFFPLTSHHAQVAMQAISWTGQFVHDFDVVLVSNKKRLNLGIKGLRKDGDTTRTYSIPLHEKAGWVKVRTPTRHSWQSNVTAEDFILCLNSLVGLRIRGASLSLSLSPARALSLSLTLSHACHRSGAARRMRRALHARVGMSHT